MKSQFELHFEKKVIAAISERDFSAKKRAELFHEFFTYGSDYYEEFCDALFLLSSGERIGSLYITPTGRSYISFGKKNIDDVLLLNCLEIPPFHEDLNDQLVFLMKRWPLGDFSEVPEKRMVDFGSTM